MGSVIPFGDYAKFEAWAIKNYPDEWAEWETEASMYLDFDQWAWLEYPEIISEWRNTP